MSVSESIFEWLTTDFAKKPDHQRENFSEAAPFNVFQFEAYRTANHFSEKLGQSWPHLPQSAVKLDLTLYIYLYITLYST